MKMKRKFNPKLFMLVIFVLWFMLAVYHSVNGSGST